MKISLTYGSLSKCLFALSVYLMALLLLQKSSESETHESLDAVQDVLSWNRTVSSLSSDLLLPYPDQLAVVLICSLITSILLLTTFLGFLLRKIWKKCRQENPADFDALNEPRTLPYHIPRKSTAPAKRRAKPAKRITSKPLNVSKEHSLRSIPTYDLVLRRTPYSIQPRPQRGCEAMTSINPESAVYIRAPVELSPKGNSLKNVGFLFSDRF